MTKQKQILILFIGIIQSLSSTANSTGQISTSVISIIPKGLDSAESGLLPRIRDRATRVTPTVGNASSTPANTNNCIEFDDNGDCITRSAGTTNSGTNSGGRPAPQPGRAGTTTGSSTSNRPNTGSSSSTSTTVKFQVAAADQDITCNLFDNQDYSSLLKAVSTLNIAIQSPTCGTKEPTMKTVIERNNHILDAFQQLEEFRNNQVNNQSIDPSVINNMTENIDSIMRSLTDIANTFSQSDLFSERCSPQTLGQSIIAINQLINGVIPYAITVASKSGVGAQALPYLVGGTAVTNALSSMIKSIQDQSVNVNEPEIRKAIVENTCQYIKIQRKFDFLLASRNQQVVEISRDLKDAVNFFNYKFSSVSNELKSLFAYKAKVTLMNSQLKANNELDFQAMINIRDAMNSQDNASICSIGKHLNIQSKSENLFPNTVINHLKQALELARDKQEIAANAYIDVQKNAAQMIDQLFSKKPNAIMTDNKKCSEMTQSWVTSIDRSIRLTQQLILKSEKDMKDELMTNSDYREWEAMNATLEKKKTFAKQVILAMDNLKAQSGVFSRSEMNIELSRLRAGLLENPSMTKKSPVLIWLGYQLNEHRRKANAFINSLNKLRLTAYRDTASGKKLSNTTDKFINRQDADSIAARNLKSFNLVQYPIGSYKHQSVCRELSDAWSKWVAAVDHLGSADLFCNMLGNQIFDNRESDKPLVQFCRGEVNLISGNPMQSEIAKAKSELIQTYRRDWALVVYNKMNSLLCPSALNYQ